MRYTMINGLAEGKFELLCFKSGECVSEAVFDSESAAESAAQIFLNQSKIFG